MVLNYMLASFLITGLVNAVDISSNTKPTLKLCQLYGNRYAFACEYPNVDFATGYTLVLTESGDTAINVEAVKGISDLGILGVAEIDEANKNYTCHIKKNNTNATSGTSDEVSKDTAEACIKSATGTVTFCRQYKNRVAVTCSLVSADWPILDVSKGHTMKLKIGANNVTQNATNPIYAKNSITQFYRDLPKVPGYKCYIHKDNDESQISKTVGFKSLAGDTKYCVKNVASTLTVTVESSKKFLFECAVSGGTQLDVSQGHDMTLKLGGNIIPADQNVTDIFNKTSITRNLTTYDEKRRNEYTCQIEVHQKIAQKSNQSLGLIEVHPCNTKPAKDSASGAATSLTLIAGCVVAALLKLAH